MGLFFNKNKKTDNAQYNEFKNFDDSLNKLLNEDKYLSKKFVSSICILSKDTYESIKVLSESDLLKSYCKKNKLDYNSLLKYYNDYEKMNELISEHNNNYINKHLVSDKDYLDSILKEDDPNILLDEEQRRVVLSDDDYTLVVAGAGSGKTTTIEAKVKFLIDKKIVSPEDILIIAFTRKATGELKSRFKKLNINVNINTFHSIGNTIIKNDEQIRHRIVTPSYKYDVIKNFLSKKIDDEVFLGKILLFFASYLSIPFNESDTVSLYNALSNDSFYTMKSDLEQTIKNYQEEQTKARRTINNEKVRSIDECRIANYLYINGIDYEYEPIYRYGFSDSIKVYTPDFLIKQNGKEIYLEHFGISQDGKNPRFTAEELEKYKNSVNKKILLHREHGTKLIYTFSKYNDKRDLITHLKEELEKAGITFCNRDKKEIYKQIINSAQEKYFNKFIILICDFISKMKIDNYSLLKFNEWKKTINDERTKLFLNIAYQCALEYDNKLKDDTAIDFEDMINDALIVLDKKIENNEMLTYKYILVDEYQDISLQRYDLCEKLVKVSDAKIIAVGDDWQSIYAFSGSRIDLFTRFKEIVKDANILKITKTYRNSQELIDIAGDFIMKNDIQIKKSLRSDKKLDDPVVLVSYDDSYKQFSNVSPFHNLGLAIEKCLELICTEFPEKKDVLLIGRYGFEFYKIGMLDDLFDSSKKQIKSRKFPQLNLHYLTAHSSKGLGYDNVVIINGKDNILGFPSKIDDDPIMKLVIKEDESMNYAEERRLFYVALTRTKNKVYIVSPMYHTSEFILELKEAHPNIPLYGDALSPTRENEIKYKCPICGYPLQKRKSKLKKFDDKSLWICSNDPEICGFVTNDLMGGKMAICKCPECEDGYLVVKRIKDKYGVDSGRRMLGCTNYKEDKTGCMYSVFPDCYENEFNTIEFAEENQSLDTIILMGYPAKKLILSIVSIVECSEKKYKFKFNIYSLKNFLCGLKDKSLEAFKMNKDEDYGMIENKYSKHIARLINILIEKGIFKVDTNGYNSLSVLKKEISDNNIKIIYSEIVN